ncbi:MBL fold metallo-hydrolase [Paenibacillus marchantiophytorum]|uniref:MBL fold metallo-hydrolase n=1 Tax=Paenibacillus marchantiophytorum TaxID=1619310 RepID=A0ABQ2BQB0_9BACL|nr:MBL fold metallo-hydrolase [Paenibacillus marchantiophytorum]GGI45085.1 MBL fold metallo-hydrolase [Paenibacillus marchantiophytorum]
MQHGTKSNIVKVDVMCSFMAAGYCTHTERVTIRDGSLQTVRFPALFALIQHPRLGYILFDTGYTERFFHETSKWPFSLYARMTPVFYKTEESAAYQLRQQGIAPEEIGYIILSHFHADHVAGLQDFPNARFLYSQEAYDAVRHRSGWKAVIAGYLPGLLPSDFEARSQPFDETQRIDLPEGFPFSRGLDILGDGSLIAVDVPGHATGQIGLLLSTGSETYFLCADAVWSSRAYREHLLPHRLAGIIMADRHQYQESFARIYQLHKQYPDIRIIPSHCSEVWEELVPRGGRS